MLGLKLNHVSKKGYWSHIPVDFHTYQLWWSLVRWCLRDVEAILQEYFQELILQIDILSTS